VISQDTVTTIFFHSWRYTTVAGRQGKIDQLKLIVLEAKQITDRRNSCLISRARISDGSARWLFAAHKRRIPCFDPVDELAQMRLGVR
jgi:hypothetical protein